MIPKLFIKEQVKIFLFNYFGITFNKKRRENCSESESLNVQAKVKLKESFHINDSSKIS
jgi:hypothetical protein